MQASSTSAPEPSSSLIKHGNVVSLALQQSVPITTAPTTSKKRRRSPKSMATSSVKRFATVQNVGGFAGGDAGMSMADRRRNKLGYHRTSVACGHCRRRKIRCLLAPDDARNRCSNCIRLKKECNFFPVDQQPERTPRTASKSEMKSGHVSNSSSPSSNLVGGRVVDQVDQFNPYSPLPLPGQEYPPTTTALNGGILSPPSRASSSSRPYEFPPPQDRSPWTPHFIDHSQTPVSHIPPEDPSTAYWKLSHSPITTVFSPPFVGRPTSSAQHPREHGGAFAPFSGSREDAGWQVPPRSLSFSQVHDLSNYQNHYHQTFQHDPRRRASDLQPPSLQTSANSSNTSISEVQPTPLSAPISSQPMHHYGLPPAWNSLPDHSPMNKAPEIHGWYSDPVQLAKAQADGVGPHYGGNDPSLMYPSAGRQ
ncbi:hypothetical protein MMC12_005460 [Toensbergia leucococca]|nr:hypothetical protein [Toensbergia leucococca]